MTRGDTRSNDIINSNVPSGSRKKRISSSERNHSAKKESLLDLLDLPPEILMHVLSFLPASTLAALSMTSQLFSKGHRVGGNAAKRTRPIPPNLLSLVEKIAMNKLIELRGSLMASRWRNWSWLERLKIDEVKTGFDVARGERTGFTFSVEAEPERVTQIKLEGIGPKLLVSDVTTEEVPILRWRLELKGNNAVEFGTVPIALQDQSKALHKCLQDETSGERPAGFSSAITVGSMLPFKVPLMKGSIIEILVTRGSLDLIVINPNDAIENVWQNSQSVPKPYNGPREFRLQQDINPEQPVKLAMTAWAKSTFDVLP